MKQKKECKALLNTKPSKAEVFNMNTHNGNKNLSKLEAVINIKFNELYNVVNKYYLLYAKNERNSSYKEAFKQIKEQLFIKKADILKELEVMK